MLTIIIIIITINIVITIATTTTTTATTIEDASRGTAATLFSDWCVVIEFDVSSRL